MILVCFSLLHPLVFIFFSLILNMLLSLSQKPTSVKHPFKKSLSSVLFLSNRRLHPGPGAPALKLLCSHATFCLGVRKRKLVTRAGEYRDEVSNSMWVELCLCASYRLLLHLQETPQKDFLETIIYSSWARNVQRLRKHNCHNQSTEIAGLKVLKIKILDLGSKQNVMLYITA